MTDTPVDYIHDKFTRILEFTLEQAKQKFALHEIEKKTIKELKAIADEIKLKEAHENITIR